LVELGFTVSWPLNTDTYDLIAEKDGSVKRIQVKTATLSKHHSYRCGLLHGTGKQRRGYTVKDCDFIILYAPFAKDYKDVLLDGYYVIPVLATGDRISSAVIFPAGKGKGNIMVCKWEKYKDGWKSI
jgi:hypothetical protein